MYATKREMVDRLARGGDGELAEWLAKLMERLANSAVQESKKQQGLLARPGPDHNIFRQGKSVNITAYCKVRMQR